MNVIKKDRAPAILTFSVILIVIIALFFTIKILAENRTKEFVVENYVMHKDIYDSKEKAMEKVVISEIHWGFKNYCTVATFYIDHGGNEISTSIPLKIPVFRYAFNTASEEDVTMVGEC